MTKSRLVIFDICGTLFFSNTSFDFLDLIVQAKSYSLFRKVSKTIFARIINKVSVLLLKKDLIRSIAVLYIKQRNGKMMRPILALLIAKLFGEAVQ